MTNEQNLLKKRQSSLLIVDVQEKLIAHVCDNEKIIRNCCWLIKLAREFEVPVLVTEQYPKGLGQSEASIKALIKTSEVIDKVHFSCLNEVNCLEKFKASDKEQFVLAGIETHVCVLQTAIGLHAQGKQVFVVVDACSSRNPEDKNYGIARMRQVGIEIVTKEMVFFEWCHQAGTEQFRKLSKAFL